MAGKFQDMADDYRRGIEMYLIEIRHSGMFLDLGVSGGTEMLCKIKDWRETQALDFHGSNLFFTH